jgi:hypothetical protein
MTDLTTTQGAIPAMSADALMAVREFEAEALAQPQCQVKTHHVLHGGIYSRTMQMPASSVTVGALIKIDTTVVTSGHLTIYTGAGKVDLIGHTVTPARAGRKQIVFAHRDSDFTMLFATDAKTVEEAEAEFTDEVDMLGSHNNPENDIVVITGR